MPATLLREAAPAASALRPTGPAARETLPPRVREPAWAKVLTALRSLRIKTKSVSSKPIWPPKPAPAVAMALGALQEPSGRRATTRPLPKRPEPRKPALRTVMMARPLALARMEGGMTLSGPKAWRGLTKEARILPHFLHSAGEDVSMSRRGEAWGALRGFADSHVGLRGDVTDGAGEAGSYSHCMEEGRGLWRPMMTKSGGVGLCAKRVSSP